MHKLGVRGTRNCMLTELAADMLTPPCVFINLPHLLCFHVDVTSLKEACMNTIMCSLLQHRSLNADQLQDRLPHYVPPALRNVLTHRFKARRLCLHSFPAATPASTRRVLAPPPVMILIVVTVEKRLRVSPRSHGVSEPYTKYRFIKLTPFLVLDSIVVS